MDPQNLHFQTRQYFSRDASLGNLPDDTIRRVMSRMVALSLDEIFDDYDCFLRPLLREGKERERKRDEEREREIVKRDAALSKWPWAFSLPRSVSRG